MAPPSFYNTDYRRRSMTGITDVQTLMDAIDDELKSQLPVASRWTEPVADTYLSPADAVGRFMKATLSRVSISRMQFRVKDQNDVTIFDGTIDRSGTATARIWSGPSHLWVELQSGATFE